MPLYFFTYALYIRNILRINICMPAQLKSTVKVVQIVLISLRHNLYLSHLYNITWRPSSYNKDSIKIGTDRLLFSVHKCLFTVVNFQQQFLFFRCLLHCNHQLVLQKLIAYFAAVFCRNIRVIIIFAIFTKIYKARHVSINSAK